MGKKSSEDVSIRDSLCTGEPITRFFYEYQGERSVDPATLIDNGVDLWREQIDSNEVHDNGFLWDFAESLLDSRQETPMYSWAEWLRYRVSVGAVVPAKWNARKPYPYKGLLISAIYFQEARRLCVEKNPERAWHLVVIAYYHLGMNTTPSSLQNTSKAAQVLHAARTEKVRAIVLALLDRVKREASADSIKTAKDKVASLLRTLEKKEGVVKDWLDEFDTLVSKKTKGRTVATQKNDVVDRIRNLLDTWALPSGPYPDIAERFSWFSKKKKGATTTSTDELVNFEQAPGKFSDYYLRIINLLEDGCVLTTKVSQNAGG